MNYRRICVWTGPLGQTEGLMRSLTSHSGTAGLRDPFSREFLRLTGAREAAPHVGVSITTHAELTVLRSPAAHALGLDLRLFADDLHLFFIQHPDERLPSLAQAIGDPDWQVRAYTWQEKLYRHFREMGADCLVLDAGLWRSTPLHVIRLLADQLGTQARKFNPVVPQASHHWRGEAWLSLGSDADLRDVCLKSYYALLQQAMIDFASNELVSNGSLAVSA